jgi:hypothetical protein
MEPMNWTKQPKKEMLRNIICSKLKIYLHLRSEIAFLVNQLDLLLKLVCDHGQTFADRMNPGPSFQL